MWLWLRKDLLLLLLLTIDLMLLLNNIFLSQFLQECHPLLSQVSSTLQSVIFSSELPPLTGECLSGFSNCGVKLMTWQCLLKHWIVFQALELLLLDVIGVRALALQVLIKGFRIVLESPERDGSEWVKSPLLRLFRTGLYWHLWLDLIIFISRFTCIHQLIDRLDLRYEERLVNL